jgi:6-phosphogluconolactonase (cycloisomerase 2 family)
MSRISFMVAAVVAGTIAFAGVASADPSPGALVQLPPPAACLSTTAASGCSAFGLAGVRVTGARSLAVSDDGRDVYVGGLSGGGAFLSRSATGTLAAFGGADAYETAAYATHGAGLFGAVLNNYDDNGEVSAFARGADGTPVLVTLARDNCSFGDMGCLNDNGLYRVVDVAVAPDGTHLYAAADSGGGSLAGSLTAFTVDPGTQAIAEVQCVPSASGSSSCTGTPTPALGGANGVVTSPDGRFVYATGAKRDSVVGFNVVQSGAGAGQIGNEVDCLWAVAATSECRQVPLVGEPAAIAMSPDGRDLYVASRLGGISALRRDTTSGVLGFTQCVTASAVGPCSVDSELAGSTFDVAVSPDGRYVYVAGGDGARNGYVISYARDAATGALARIGCVTNLPMADCTTAAGLAGANNLAISPDGAFVYVAAFAGGDGNGALAAFRVQQPQIECLASGPPCQGPPIVKDTTAPHSRVSGLRRRVKAKALKGFHGTASDDRGVARVEVSLVRLRGGARIARATCRALTSRGRFHALKVRHGRCSPSGFLRAKGTTRWSFALKHRLPKGSYVLTVRATDAAGNAESGFSSRKHDRVAFTVT